MRRRDFVRNISAAGTAAALGACNQRPQAAEMSERAVPWVKDPTPFRRHPTNLETPIELLTDLITPNDLFFVRNHAPTPLLDAESFRLRVTGDAVDGETELSYEDILGLPSSSLTAYLECAGNWRGFSQILTGRLAQGGQWHRGAVGCAEWTGVKLADVLDRAGLKSSAVDVNLVGLDDGGFNRPMPIAKALDSDTLLVHTMNGAPLPPDHGYPIRAIVPGWAGSNSIKWLGQIRVSASKLWVKANTTSYVMIGPAWPSAEHQPAEGEPITVLNVKSVLALPWPAALGAGLHRIGGFAYSPHGRVQSVVFSTDEAEWRPARLLEPVLARAWAQFEFDWEAVAGEHTVRVRATDERGNTQPLTARHNTKGYLLNAPLPHPITVQ